MPKKKTTARESERTSKPEKSKISRLETINLKMTCSFLRRKRSSKEKNSWL